MRRGNYPAADPLMIATEPSDAACWHGAELALQMLTRIAEEDAGVASGGAVTED